jgi:hypothetical protein
MTCPVCGRAQDESATACACGYNFKTGHGGAAESTRKLAFRAGIALLCISVIFPITLGVLVLLQSSDQNPPPDLGVTFVLTLLYCAAGGVVGVILIRKGRRVRRET